jgi:hypothetical protein
LTPREILVELQLQGNAMEKPNLTQRFKLKSKKGQWLALAAGHVDISVTRFYNSRVLILSREASKLELR